MSMGRCEAQPEKLWIATDALRKSHAHPFYDRLNQVLEAAGFDRFVESACARFYAARMGRPSVAPGRYFRMILIGFFEGLGSERGIAWKVNDSMSLHQFLRLRLDQPTPDHSTLSKTRQRIDWETHLEVFQWVLRRMEDRGLLKGRSVGIDATLLAANAAIRAVVRRDTEEGYEEWLRRLAKESGVDTPTREALLRFDRGRKKKMSNKEWKHPHEPDSRVAKMKDGRVRMAHKAEHAVDLESGAVVGLTLATADQGDTKTLGATLAAAEQGLEAASGARAEKPEVVADRGYHSDATMTALKASGHRSYVPEPKRDVRRWQGRSEAQSAVYANRRRVRGARGKRLSKLRSEKVERSFAHCYETGGMRQVHLRGHNNILKRLIVHCAAFNLSILMRKVCGVGKPRVLQGRRSAPISGLEAAFSGLRRPFEALSPFWDALFGVSAIQTPVTPPFAWDNRVHPAPC